jgi:DNA-binding NarL/FixJ family response regulator
MSARNRLSVLLATNRAAIRSYFTYLGRSADQSFALACVPVDVNTVAESTHELDACRVAVIDVGSDPTIALAMCVELQARRADLPKIALLCCPHSVTHWHVQALVAAGVHSIVDLHAAEDETRRVLHTVAAGNVVLRIDLGAEGLTVLGGIAGTTGPAGHPVNKTDVRIVELVAQGLSDREIARRLHLSPHTVSHHIARVSDGVGARNRTALAAWAGGHGFYHPPAVPALRS